MLAGAAFTLFFTAFLWCFLAVFAVAAAAGLELAAGAGVWAPANGRDILASPRAMVRIVVFIFFFLPRGPCRPLTIPYCALPVRNSIASVGYKHPPNRGYRG